MLVLDMPLDIVLLASLLNGKTSVSTQQFRQFTIDVYVVNEAVNRAVKTSIVYTHVRCCNLEATD